MIREWIITSYCYNYYNYNYRYYYYIMRGGDCHHRDQERDGKDAVVVVV